MTSAELAIFFLMFFFGCIVALIWVIRKYIPKPDTLPACFASYEVMQINQRIKNCCSNCPHETHCITNHLISEEVKKKNEEDIKREFKREYHESQTH